MIPPSVCFIVYENSFRLLIPMEYDDRMSYSEETA